jgi:hypothetical protein
VLALGPLAVLIEPADLVALDAADELPFSLHFRPP